MTDEDSKITELDPSKLGTKDYWENAYKLELNNYTDHGDVGEVWFGEDAVKGRVYLPKERLKYLPEDVSAALAHVRRGQRMVNWLSEHPEYVQPSDPVLDNGTGNGVLCMDMEQEGFTDITGIDYCQEAIDLAEKIKEEAESQVKFQVGNILDKESSFFKSKFKVVTDKGTYDAISLSETAKVDKVTYIENTHHVLERGGLFMITSCNWTEQELVTMFSTHFKHLETIPTPSFTFGGKKGNSGVGKMATGNALKRGVYVVAAKRTPFGTFGGTLKGHSPTELQVHAAQAAIASAGLKPENINSVCIGNVLSPSAPDAPYLARHVALRCGLPVPTPALIVNRLCGSGFQSIVNGVQEILVGDSEIVLTGGTDNMSACPYAVRDIRDDFSWNEFVPDKWRIALDEINSYDTNMPMLYVERFGTRLGMDPKLEDMMWTSLTDMLAKTPMGVTAENLAEKYGVTREESDNFAIRSQQTWAKAAQAGVFADEIAPIQIKTKKGMVDFALDEHPKPKTTIEQLAKLPTVFKKNGVVTAGSASGICDGAAAVIIASEEAVAKHGLTPLARIVGYGVAGCEPTIMGIGPVPAIGVMMEKAGVSLGEVDQVEINEAFGAQALSCQKALDIPMEKFNTCGGAIALGHPLAASGSRISAHVVHKLRQNGQKYGIGSACIGGGQGISILFERV